MKNKTAFKILALFILSLFSQLIYAQNILIGKSMVISTTGLNMRSEPNLNGEILAKIPFGEYVEVTENKSYGYDTIGGYSSYRFNEEKEYINTIHGDWVKIKHKAQRGYVFKPYLLSGWQLDHLENKNKGLNKDYVLLFPTASCSYNFWYDPTLNWYGVYQNSGGCELRETGVRFFTIKSMMFDGEIDAYISATEVNKLLFIVGSKKKLNQKKLNGKFHNWWSDEFENLTQYRIDTTEFKLGLQVAGSGKFQTLNPETTRYGPWPTGLLWKGDIDGDNKNDYIFHYGDKSAQTILYLSSEADENQVVKPVAIFYSSYCC